MSATDFRQNYDLMPQASMTLDRDLVFKNANQAYCRAVRRSKKELIGKYIFDAFPDTDERIQPVLESFTKAVNGEISRMESVPYQLQLPDGHIEDRLWDIENQPLYAQSGDVIGLVQFCEDVTEREALRKERDLVSAELAHRVRNTMAVVQSVAEHTGQTSSTIDEFLEGFSGRLMSMSRSFSALSNADWNGLDLDVVLQTELEPYLAHESERITFSGPNFNLSVKSTKDASMIFHELVTNALKHGFLTVPEGRLEVSWGFDGKHLTVTWNEYGLTGLKPPERTGFGFQMMEMFPNLGFEKTFADDGIKLRARIPADIASGQIMFMDEDA
jgi:PAS domain S-box-containing protein